MPLPITNTRARNHSRASLEFLDCVWGAGASLLSRACEDTAAEFRMDIDFSHW
jgi:hypothetical protein